MKPMIFVPPAQAEALSDTQENWTPEDLRFGDLGLRQPWRDEDTAGELLPEIVPRQRPEMAVSKAQLWPSSVNNSR